MGKVVYLVPAGMSLIALLDMPYGYYQLLRFVVCICAGLLTWELVQREVWIGTVAFGLMAVIFNPIIPLHFAREIWAILNITTAAIFLIGLILYMRKSKDLMVSAHQADQVPPSH